MNKIAGLLTAILIAGAVAVKMNDVRFEAPQLWLDEDRDVRELVFRYQSFKEIFDDTLENLGHGKIDLRTARTRVEAASRCYWPAHVEFLTFAENGSTSEERIARNLVEHLRSVQNLEPHLKPRVRELEIELAELLREGRPPRNAKEPR